MNGLNSAGAAAAEAMPDPPPSCPGGVNAPNTTASVDRLVEELAEQKEALAREAEQLRQDLDCLSQHVAAMAGLEESWSIRQRELRGQLVTLHAQLSRRDEDLRDSVRELTAQRDAAAGQRDAALAERDVAVAERNALRLQRDEAVRQRDGLLFQWEALLFERNALDARLARIRQSLPGRLYRGVRRLLGRS